jgi:hypothetical protein
MTFEVDLDLLDDTVAEMTRCGESLDVLLAQDGAQAEWEAGFRQMRDALAAMRTAAQVAHGNYVDAASTNLRMWEQAS